HGESARSVYNRVVHDMGIAPEAFMATDVIVTLGTVKDRRTGNLIRKMNELVCTGTEPGSFIDVSSPDRMFDAPAIKRAMQISQLSRGEVSKEIRARSNMRSYLAELGKKDERYLGPEWISVSNEIVSRMPADASADTMLNELKRKVAGADV
ncbi:MAG: type IV secretion system protein VirB11, partial [Candidatus Methanomethylophilaceae archaeon]|nr:type IV secretion system protein VirB11 [Candidatus Methanomethylophilaceae archaeon]